MRHLINTHYDFVRKSNKMSRTPHSNNSKTPKIIKLSFVMAKGDNEPIKLPKIDIKDDINRLC
jgi:hypothetical protein